MSFAVVQATSVRTATGTGTQTLAFTSAVTPGNLLLAFVTSEDANATPTVSDGVNGSYTSAISAGATLTNGIFFFPSTASGTPTVTAVCGASVNHVELIIAELSGAAASPLDATGTGSQTSATPSISTSGSTVAAHELVVSSLVTSTFPTIAAGTGYTQFVANPGNALAEYNLDSGVSLAVQTAGYTLGSSIQAVMCIATFKPSASVSVPSGGMCM